MIIQLSRMLWGYFLANTRAILITGTIAFIGSAITLYGWLNGITYLLYIGPIIATSGKLLLALSLIIPAMIAKMRGRKRKKPVVLDEQN